MRKVLALVAVLICYASFSQAQQQKSADPAKWDIFAGYSLSRIYVADFPPFPLVLNGGQASATYYPTKHLGATAEMAGYTADVDGLTISTQGYLFGPTVRFGINRLKLKPVSFFADQLFGVTHIALKADNGNSCTQGSVACTTNSFTMVSGGGVDVKLTKHISVRPLQMEYFSQQISLQALVGNASVGVRNAASGNAVHPDTSSPFNGLDIVGRGFRYSAGAVVRF